LNFLSSTANKKRSIRVAYRVNKNSAIHIKPVKENQEMIDVVKKHMNNIPENLSARKSSKIPLDVAEKIEQSKEKMKRSHTLHPPQIFDKIENKSDLSMKLIEELKNDDYKEEDFWDKKSLKMDP